MDMHVLDTLDAQRLGQELQRARKRAGLTQEAAAKVIGASSHTTIVAIEKGDRRIKSIELVKLAKAYGSSVHDFVRQRPDIEPLDVQFRGPWLRTEQDEKGVSPAIIEFEELCRNYLELEQLTGSPMVRKYPSEYEIAGLPVESTAETIATEERNRLGLGDRPIPILRDVLEQDVGLRIFFIKMPSNFSEIYAYTDQLGGCLAVNSVHPEERRRWSMAHGYFHFLSTRHKLEVTIEDRYQRQPESERFADTFARYFLMPSAGLMRRFTDAKQHSKVTPALLCTWANYYGVSTQAITLRFESMRLLPSGTWDKIKASLKVRELQRELGLEDIPSRANKHPIRYSYLAIDAFQTGQITEGELARFLEVDRIDARHLTEEGLLEDPVSAADESGHQSPPDLAQE